MAESLLKNWHASALVSAVIIDGLGAHVAASNNAEVTGLHKDARELRWTEQEKALPLPLPAPGLDPVMDAVVHNSDLLQALDQETLTVTDLKPGNYALMIDGRTAGTLSAGDLAKGVNLATMETPMLDQARLVAFDTERKNALEGQRFELIRKEPEAENSPTAKAMLQALPAAVDRQRTNAQPRPHQFRLTWVSADAQP